MIGKEGPARIQDSTAAPDGNQTLILDDATGHEGGFGLPAWFTRQMKTGLCRRRRARKPGAQYRAGSLADEGHHPHRAAAFRAKTANPSRCCSGRAIPTCSQHNTKDSVGEYGARHQWTQRHGRHPRCRHHAGRIAGRAEGAGPGQDHRCLRHRRSRLHHRQPCQRHQPLGATSIPTRR